MAQDTNSLPDIETIVDQRVAAGIAGNAEFQLWTKGDLDNSSYSDDFKQQLLAELEEARSKKKALTNAK